MRWSWVLLATSPCGFASKQEHPHPSAATVTSNGLESTAIATWVVPILTMVVLAVVARATPSMAGRERALGHSSSAHELAAIERSHVEGADPERARSEGADNGPG